MLGIGVTQPPWEVERRRRGQQRYYPFDVLPSNGFASAGSSAIVAAPNLSMTTGGATATPQNRGREQVERKGGGGGTNDSWTGSDGLNYWGRRHHMYAWYNVGAGAVTPIGARLHAGIFRQSFFSIAGGTPANPNNPLVYLRYVRNGTLELLDERFELLTAVGDTSPTVVTRLTGVPGPRTDATGTPWTQRMELFYDPGVAVYAYIDGVLGAVATTGLPDVTRVPLPTLFIAGWGTYLEAAQVGDSGQASFHNSLIETYRL